MSDLFCPDARTRREFDRIARLVRESGFEVQEGDYYLLGAFANGAARLEQLAELVSREKDPERRLRLMGAERLARGDVSRLIDQLERHYAGVDVEESAPELRQTGTDGKVIPFNRGLSRVAQRIVAVLGKAKGPLTREALRRRVPGSQGAFLKALREALAAGVLARSGAGRKGSPHVYSRR
jgi:hypothetical protein